VSFVIAMMIAASVNSTMATCIQTRTATPRAHSFSARLMSPIVRLIRRLTAVIPLMSCGLRLDDPRGARRAEGGAGLVDLAAVVVDGRDEPAVQRPDLGGGSTRAGASRRGRRRPRSRAASGGPAAGCSWP
jgi:hypothetical protein